MNPSFKILVSSEKKGLKLLEFIEVLKKENCCHVANSVMEVIGHKFSITGKMCGYKK